MSLLRLALGSLLARRWTVLLAVISIAISVALLLSVERLREGARSSFAGTISDTDLIIGARTGGVQLMLYSVFRIGNATNNFTWKTYRDIASDPAIDWIVPISLGDSHRGFRVVGTTRDYFTRLKVRGGKQLRLAQGKPFDDLFDVVLGADVAAQLGYRLGEKIVVSHGTGAAGLTEHEDKPFRVAGILEKTGTPIDRSLHVSLEAIEAIHVDWQAGAPIPGVSLTPDQVRSLPLKPRAVTAAFVGLKSRIAVFRVQRAVNEYAQEPMTAVLPGVALQELWSVVGVAESALRGVSVLVVIAALLGMTTMLLATLNERRREMAILRANGARAGTIFGLLMIEAAAIALTGALLGLLLHLVAMAGAGAWLDRSFGLYIPWRGVSWQDLGLLAGIIVAATLTGLVPALRAYRLSLIDGIGARL
ncbi:MAG: ABC transporter permease [Neomegalonema sp.]|nr:ABC transporter permease [Neomegalonema sp.]